ncbi:hypothetical protein FWK35_00004213 [Aphis craccivora]|uniref:Uncharacterized protein n=1 Tax=Aphis craccivora TaxID=307492 RepID=A0A6G0Z825_APHCR|nr:hypothetical protein FWK35_00004213 [Aphis craccivora]
MRNIILHFKNLSYKKWVSGYRSAVHQVPCGSLFYIIGGLNLNPMIIIIVYKKRF